jgi:uncharacterized protein with von Willebrand factor type A (vWA) domain
MHGKPGDNMSNVNKGFEAMFAGINELVRDVNKGGTDVAAALKAAVWDVKEEKGLCIYVTDCDIQAIEHREFIRDGASLK